jgi:thioredoxin reductase
MTGTGIFDTVVIGGGAAGLSGATALGRARRSVLVIDAGEPRNAPADGVHNFLTRDGMNPLALQAAGRAEAEAYGVRFLNSTATGASGGVGDFTVTLADGDRVRARRLLVTTGVTDILPDVAGLRDRWGRDVIHCPYCHGWEVRDRAIAVIGSGPMTMHQALLFRQWSANVTLFVHTAPAPTQDEREQLAARGIRLIEGLVTSVDVTDDAISGVTTADGRTEPAAAVVVGPRMEARSGVLADLGLTPIEHSSGVGTHIQSQQGGVTSVPGVWVAGNVTDLVAQVVTAASAGLMAGATINADLLAEELADDLARYRARGPCQQTPQPMFEPDRFA